MSPQAAVADDATALTLQAWTNLKSTNPAILIETVPEFIARVEAHQTPLEDRLAILNAGKLLFRNFYPHLSFKQKLYIDANPVEALEAIAAQAASLSEVDFHTSILRIFDCVRDAHSLYAMPGPFRNAIAMLPFEMRPAVDAEGHPRYIVTKTMDAGGDAGLGHPVFGVGVEITGWGGRPIGTYILDLAVDQPGGNPAAIMIRASIAATVRPLTWMRLPFLTEELTTVEYVPATGGGPLSISLPWRIVTGLTSQGKLPPGTFSVSQTMSATSLAQKMVWSVTAGSGMESADEQDVPKLPEAIGFAYTGGPRQEDLIDPALLSDPANPAARFGYLQIKRFSCDQPPILAAQALVAEFKRVLTRMNDVAPDGLILDIRGNPGGDVHAAERMLQMLTSATISPTTFHFANTPAIREIIQFLTDNPQKPGEPVRLINARQAFKDWLNDPMPSPETNPLTSGRTVTPSALANDTGRVYKGRVVLLIDALTYSAADIFAAGFQDHEIGAVIGAAPNTGGGGGQVWHYEDFLNHIPETPNVKVPSLPGDSTMTLAIRRCLRVNKQAGQPVEDVGVNADLHYQPNRARSDRQRRPHRVRPQYSGFPDRIRGRLLNPGDTISRYRIVGPLGKGGMGVVYRAEDTRLNRPVALKFLPSESLADDDRIRFLNEAQTAARVRHPNICPIYDIEEADGQIFIAMACLEGETLSRRIDRGPLDPAAAVHITLQILAGLAMAHEAGVVHRDIKSPNILLGRDGHVCILDFGLAVWAGSTRVTRAGQTVGTPGYMSPEQMLDSGVDPRSDIWSTGVVLFEMLTGEMPFRRQHGGAVAHAILTADVPPMPGVPEELAAVVRKALAKDPRDRWQTASEMSLALERADVPGAPERTQTMLLPAVRRRASGRRSYIVAALALLLLGGAFAAYRMWPAHIVQVAVVPFNVIGSAESTRNISDGFVEVLTTALSEVEQTQGNFVTVPASEVRRRHIDSAEEARRVYGVDFAITGSAQPLAQKVEFTANLVDTASKRTINGKHFEYDPGNAIASRDEAVANVVQLLRVRLSKASKIAIAAGDTKTPAAFNAYLEGRGLLSRYDLPGNIEKAVTAFQSATRLDPGYALAYTGLAEAYWRNGRLSGDKQAAALAVENAQRAVQLDPELSQAHTVLGQVYGAFGRQQEAVTELKKALAEAPANADAARELARVYTNLGMFSEAETSYLNSIRTRPTDWYGYLLLGIFYSRQERYQDAISTLSIAKRLTPDNDAVSTDLGNIYLHQGRYKEAEQELGSVLNSKPSARTYAALASVYFYEHRFQQAASASEAALKLDSTRYVFFGNAAIYYKWAGYSAKSAAALNTALQLCSKLLEVTPDNYDARADLAEYRARSGDTPGTLAEIALIPEAARRARASQLAIAYEFIGHRAEAVALIASNLKDSASLTRIKDDPDLSALSNSKEFRLAVAHR